MYKKRLELGLSRLIQQNGSETPLLGSGTHFESKNPSKSPQLAVGIFTSPFFSSGSLPSQGGFDGKNTDKNNVKNTGKKGQVTIFIILGLLLVIALVLVLVLRSEIITTKPEERAPSEQARVESYVIACIDQAAQEALDRVGLQGGYVEVPIDIAEDGSRHLRTSPFTVIPFWAYGMSTAIPSLEVIKQGIDDHIEEQVRHCVLNQAAFAQTYTLVEKSQIQSDTSILDSKIIFSVDWQIEVRDKAGEVITTLREHQSESPVKLKKVYETAQAAVEREMTTLKFEDLTQDLIALEHADVPVAGFEFSCSPKRWEVERVKERMKDLLRVNLREVHIRGTNVVDFPQELPYYQNHYVFDLGEEFAEPDVKVQFGFENNYPFNFDVTPRSGKYMRSNTLGGSSALLSALCLQSWKFVYDVSYPVVMTLTDETTGYVFKTAFTVHVKRNMPDRSESLLKPQSFSFLGETDSEFCQQSSVPMTILTSEVVDNPTTGVFIRNPLEGAQITFTCLRASCDMGTTEYDFAQMGDVAAYRTNFPYCVGGIVRATKDGYKESWQRVVTAPQKLIELDLSPLVEIPVSKVRVVKHTTEDGEVSAPFPLLRDETALVTLTYKKPGESTAFHEVSTVLSPSLEEQLQDETMALLADADFTYVLNVMVMNGEQFVGGYYGNWTVPWNELERAQLITLHVVASEETTEEAMYDLFSNLKEYSQDIPQPEVR